MIDRYSRKEIASIWKDEERFRFWLKVELAVLQARAEKGDIPEGAFKAIKRDASFSLKRIDELEIDLQHDMIAFVTNVGEHIGANSCYFHQGLTSSDILDTATALQLKEANEILSMDLVKLLEALKSQALKYKELPIIGRTHGMHAEATTFGLKLAGHYAELSRARDRFQYACQSVEVGKISGAVGTYSLLPPQIEERVMEILGLHTDPISTQIVQRDRLAFYLATIAVLGGSLERLALEIRHLARSEVSEVEEPFGKKQRGSSAMPHKRNPVLCERICGLARVLRANTLAGMENQALWHERDISHSSVERVILPDCTILLDYLLFLADKVVEGMEVHPEMMLANLNLSGGIVFSQAILNALLDKGLEREYAYKLVQNCAMKAKEEKQALAEVLKNHSEISRLLSVNEIDHCFKFDLKYVDYIFKRAKLIT
jgi:adenylosuccinate lyase